MQQVENHFSEIKGDVGISSHEKEEKQAAVTPRCKLPVFLSVARAVDFAHE